MRKYLIHILLVLFSVSCTGDRFIEETEPMIVVEGWIDADGYPKVILTQTIPVSDEEHQLNDLSEYIIKWAKVTISDGEKSVVLTGKYSPKYFPPYVYTTAEMRGEAGRTYYLTVQYENFYATAETTIPEKVEVKEFITGNDNGKYCIKALIDDNPDEKNYYKFFVKVVGRDSMYLSSNLAVIDDENYVFPCKIPVEIGTSVVYDINKSYILSEKDSVLIRYAQIDSLSYSFWDNYKNIIELGQNPFFRYSNSLKSNINGGLGYWFGYGVSEYFFLPYNHDNPIHLR
ncbi:MAG: DUF4249 domain-containing protein [Bacteroidaceae bacterium]|nr:DUF4249 domain-containing protein [Bacteroidaceae bacterium]